MTNSATTTVNGEAHSPQAGETILDLVAAHMGVELTAEGRAADGRNLGVAVAQDGTVIPRAKWAATPVAGAIDIVTAVQGG